MKGPLSLAIAIFLSVSAFAQRETRTIRSFDEIDVGESIDVYLTAGDSKEARIETDGDNTDRVIVENIGSTLKIHMKSGSWRSFGAEVYLEFQELESVEVSSSASVISRSVIKGDKLDIEVSSSGSAELDVDVDELDIEVSSSGKIDLKGRARSQRVEVSSSGKYYGFDLQSDEARINASSSGKAEISVAMRIDAEANSSGKVTYKGNPDKVYVDSNSGGRVREY